MKKKKNNICDLELRLRPSFGDDYSDLSPSSVDESSLYRHAATEASSRRPEHQQKTMFYDGKVAASEVTELQARAIIMLASSDLACQGTRTSSLESSKLVCNTSKSPTGLSMKRSLQRFLQKRHQRIQDSSSPYSHRKSCVFIT